MQNHVMMLNKRTVEALNPGQTAVDWSDCPVYALTKELMFRNPLSYQNYVAFMGGLHSEQTFLKIFGQLIKGCGLLDILQQNHFSTLGLSAVVDVNFITRARYALQVTLGALYAKLKEASAGDEDPLAWLMRKAETSSMCHFLHMVMTLGLQILINTRSIGNVISRCTSNCCRNWSLGVSHLTITFIVDGLLLTILIWWPWRICILMCTDSAWMVHFHSKKPIGNSPGCLWIRFMSRIMLWSKEKVV